MGCLCALAGAEPAAPRLKYKRSRQRLPPQPSSPGGGNAPSLPRPQWGGNTPNLPWLMATRERDAAPRPRGGFWCHLLLAPGCWDGGARGGCPPHQHRCPSRGTGHQTSNATVTFGSPQHRGKPVPMSSVAPCGHPTLSTSRETRWLRSPSLPGCWGRAQGLHRGRHGRGWMGMLPAPPRDTSPTQLFSVNTTSWFAGHKNAPWSARQPAPRNPGGLPLPPP